MRTLADMTLEERESMDDQMAKAIESLGGRAKKGIAAPGELRLPPALDARRIEYKIPDHVFSVEPYLDRCLIWQISRDRTNERGETMIGDTNLVMTDKMRAMRKHEAPYGILIAAGLVARSTIESHGIRLGDKVVFLRSAPFRLRTGWDGTEESKVIIVQSGDLVGSLDLRDRIVSGDETTLLDEDDEGPFYRYMNSPKPKSDEHPSDF